MPPGLVSVKEATGTEPVRRANRLEPISSVSCAAATALRVSYDTHTELATHATQFE